MTRLSVRVHLALISHLASASHAMPLWTALLSPTSRRVILAGEVDYSLYISCAHGLGHTLAFFVSSRRAAFPDDVLAICAQRAPDARVVASARKRGL